VENDVVGAGEHVANPTKVLFERAEILVGVEGLIEERAIEASLVFSRADSANANVDVEELGLLLQAELMLG
jgi:hypothetical protein